MDTEQSVGRKWMKRGAYTILGVVLFLFAFVWVGEHVDDLLRWETDRDARAFHATMVAQEELLIAMEKADTYGSTTPEGTAELIISALEDGDVELASKYYYVLDQEKALKSFKKQQAEKGNLDTAIAFFKDILNGTKKCNEAGDGCTLSYEYKQIEDEVALLPGTTTPVVFPAGGINTEANDFVVNAYTDIWKAIE